MAQYFTSFEHQPAGSQPSGWSEIWNGGNSTWNVVDSGGSKFVRNQISSTNDDRLLRWNDVPSVTNVEVVAKLRTSSLSMYQNTIHVRASSSGGASKNSYYVCLSYDGGEPRLYIEQWRNGTYYYWHHVVRTWTTNQWYWIRYRVNSNVHYVKMWNDGSSEPSSWTFTRTDTTGTAYNGSGFVAIAGYNAGGNRDFDVVGVGTNGDPAPTEPLLETLSVADVDHSTLSTTLVPEVPALPVVVENAIMYGGWGGSVVGASYFGAGPSIGETDTLLVINSADHYVTSQQRTLKEHKTLEINSSSHTHEVDSLGEFVEDSVLILTSNDHATVSEGVSLTQNVSLTVSDSSHGHAVSTADLVEHKTLSMESASHLHYVGSPELVESKLLTVDNSIHQHTSSDFGLSSEGILAADAATVGVTSTTLDITQAHTLVVASATHSHSATSPLLVRNRYLTVAGSSHQTASTHFALTQQHTIPVANTLHGHLAQSPEIDQRHYINPANTSHSIESGEVDLIEQQTLVIANSSHQTSSEIINLVQQHSLALEDAAHSTGSTQIEIDQQQFLHPADAIHTVTSDSFTMEVVATLIMEAGYHTVDSTSPHISLLVRPSTRPPRVEVYTPRVGIQKQEMVIQTSSNRPRTSIGRKRPITKTATDKPRIKI